MTIFYIVRHGQTEWNVERRIQGHSDSPLTEEGLVQAKTLGNTLNHISFDVVYSSDLLRAKRTAELIMHEKSLAIKTAQALREKNQGRLEGRLRKEVEEQLKEAYGESWEQKSDIEKMQQRTTPDSETNKEVVSRLTVFLRELAVAYPNKTILIVSHSALMNSFLVHLGFATFNELGPRAIGNAGYMVVESDGIEFFLKETAGIEKIS